VELVVKFTGIEPVFSAPLNVSVPSVLGVEVEFIATYPRAGVSVDA